MINKLNNAEELSPLVDVVLYLRGHSLDPAQVTAMLGVDGSKTRKRGDRWYTKTHKEVVAKIGLWKLEAQADSRSVSEKIGWLRQKLSSAKCSPVDIPGVQDVEVSVFVALGSNVEGAADYETMFTVEDLAWLSSIGATVSFLVTYVGKAKGSV